MLKVSAKMTPVEFLAWEREQPGKHHYIHGEIFDMAGGSARHNALSAEIVGWLAAAAKDTACRALSSDQKIGVADNVFVYADAVVVCPPLQFRPNTKDVITNPSVVVEVLSKSTEAYDRGDKFNDYIALPSLKHLMFVSQRTAHVELYTRQEDGSFRIDVFRAGSTMTLKHLNATIAIDALYAGVFELPDDE